MQSPEGGGAGGRTDRSAIGPYLALRAGLRSCPPNGAAFNELRSWLRCTPTWFNSFGGFPSGIAFIEVENANRSDHHGVYGSELPPRGSHLRSPQFAGCQGEFSKRALERG